MIFAQMDGWLAYLGEYSMTGIWWWQTMYRVGIGINACATRTKGLFDFSPVIVPSCKPSVLEKLSAISGMFMSAFIWIVIMTNAHGLSCYASRCPHSIDGLHLEYRLEYTSTGRAVWENRSVFQKFINLKKLCSKMCYTRHGVCLQQTGDDPFRKWPDMWTSYPVNFVE